MGSLFDSIASLRLAYLSAQKSILVQSIRNLFFRLKKNLEGLNPSFMAIMATV